jgi:hypothetical protein
MLMRKLPVPGMNVVQLVSELLHAMKEGKCVRIFGN